MSEWSTQAIVRKISEARFSAYLAEVDDNEANALELYRWNAAMASAMFELAGHVEVVLRNTVDVALREAWGEDERRIPWFMLRLPSVDTRLRVPEWRDIDVDRDAALARLTMGFWAKLIQVKHVWEELEPAMVPGCDHKELIDRTDRVHELRNSLAHHGSMLDVDVLAELENLLSLADLIGPDVRPWLMSLERVTSVYRSRPNTVPDTVLVPAGDAWPIYEKTGVYVCRAGRTFRPVKRFAFYVNAAIMPEVPEIIERVDDVPWTMEEADRLRRQGGTRNEQLADAIEHTIGPTWAGPKQQVFLLTRPDQAAAGHRTLKAAIPHPGTGRGSAFAQGPRYFHFSDLLSARSTTDLPRSYFLAEKLPESGISTEPDAGGDVVLEDVIATS
jgi:hypothetical protein